MSEYFFFKCTQRVLVRKMSVLTRLSGYLSFHFRQISNAHTDPYTNIFFKLILFKLDFLVLRSCVCVWGGVKVNMFQISFIHFHLKTFTHTHMYANFVYIMNTDIHSSWKHFLISFCLMPSFSRSPPIVTKIGRVTMK